MLGQVQYSVKISQFSARLSNCFSWDLEETLICARPELLCLYGFSAAHETGISRKDGGSLIINDHIGHRQILKSQIPPMAAAVAAARLLEIR